jgi:hypothetical protein
MEAGQEIMDNTGITDVMSMTEYVAGEFIGTLSTSASLTPESVNNVIIVILMFGVLWTIGLGLIIMYVFRSKYAMIWKRQDMQINLERRKRTASISKSPYAIKSYLIEYVNTVFPAVYNQTPFISRIWSEVMRHHRYVHLFIGSSMRTTKGIISGIQLLTIQTMLMFLLAVFYDLQGPSDDGSCQQYNIMDKCLKRKSFLDHTEAYCKWNYNREICSYNSPTFGWKTIAIIGIAVSMMTALINFPLDYCFDIINAPTFPLQIQIMKKKFNNIIITKDFPDRLQKAYELASSSLSVIYSVAKRIQENRSSRQFEMKKRLRDYIMDEDSDNYSEYSYNTYDNDSDRQFCKNTILSRISWGNYRAPITPTGGQKMYGRGSFYLHGGSLRGSHGCIDLTDDIEDFAKFFGVWTSTTKKKKIPLTVKYKNPLLNQVIQKLVNLF